MRLFSHWWPMPGAEPAAAAHVPQVGDTVRLQAVGTAQVGIYQAQVRAIGLRRLFLDSAEAIPASEAEMPVAHDLAFLSVRTLLVLSFVRDDMLYQCETRVVGPVKAGSLTVARPRIVTRVQRRQFYRLPLQTATTFRVLSRDGREATAPQIARLVNLSGGGALLTTSKPVPGGLRVVLRVPIGREGGLREVEAEALDCHVASQGLSRVYLVRLRFLGAPHLSDEVRDEIVAYIFEQQRILLRNRKLLRT